MSPDTAFSSRCRPSSDVGWIVYLYTYNPTVIASAITEVSRVRHVHDPVHKSECTSLFLHQRAEDYPVVHGCGVHIHGPACIRGARVHIQRINEMLLSDAVDQRIEEKRSRRQVDNWCADSANRTNISTRKTCSDRRSDIGALPNHRARIGVERINIIRCRNNDDHRSVRTALDVKRLRMNVADDCAIKVQVTDQISRIARRECWIDIQTVPRRIIVLLGDVDLCIGRQGGSAANSNEKRKFHSPEIDNPCPLLQQ
jgi:hypothetical protein